jgi:hypothetical protein
MPGSPHYEGTSRVAREG